MCCGPCITECTVVCPCPNAGPCCFPASPGCNESLCQLGLTGTQCPCPCPCPTAGGSVSLCPSADETLAGYDSDGAPIYQGSDGVFRYGDGSPADFTNIVTSSCCHPNSPTSSGESDPPPNDSTCPKSPKGGGSGGGSAPSGGGSGGGGGKPKAKPHGTTNPKTSCLFNFLNHFGSTLTGLLTGRNVPLGKTLPGQHVYAKGKYPQMNSGTFFLVIAFVSVILLMFAFGHKGES